MRCPQCRVENAADGQFCVGCGASLRRACIRCGTANALDARFCGQCGAPLSGGEGAATLARAAALDGQRKQLTVLFADLAGSTTLIESLDPEQAVARLQPAIEAMREAVSRFEGSVNKVQGDGIMALFGAPVPHEDHAVRACCAALAMQVSVAALGDAAIAVRVGLHTGEVVARSVSNDLSTDYDATGLTVHIASRMEQMAGSGNIVMTAETYKAAQNFIDAAPLGGQPVKGLTSKLEVYRLTGLKRGPASQRFRGERSLSQFIGRTGELAALDDALEDAIAGEARLIGVVGDAGVGKSRLCFEFAEVCRRRGVRVLEARALAHSRSTPFEPVIDLLRDYFRIAPDDPPQAAREKVALRLRAREAAAEDEIALMSDFLGIAGSAAPGPADAAARREKLLEMVRRLVRAGAADTPVAILIEDLHWLDSGSEAFLEAVADAIVGTRSLLLFNFRPGYSAPWMGHSYYQQLALRPLRPQAADSLLDTLVGADPSLDALTRRIVERAQGNPFFIEEQVRALAERGVLQGLPGAYALAGEAGQDVLPSTVQAIVSARIDRRPEAERIVLQTAAVIGREFTLDLLSRIAAMPALALRPLLQRLCAAELAYEVGTDHGGAYAFKHPLTQEVAYRSQLNDKRRAIHAKIAADLEQTLPDAGGAQAGYIAWHLEESGQAMAAAQWNVKAAMWHGTRDPGQAFESWKRVHRLIKQGPVEGPAKYMLMMASGQLVNFAWRIGVSQDEAQPWFDEAINLARDVGDPRAITLITAAYGRLLAASGSADDYVAKVKEALALLQLPRDRSLQVTLTAILSHAYRLAGLLEDALDANDQALAGVGDISEQDQLTLGFDIGVWIKSVRAQTLAWLARFEQALPLLDELLDQSNAKVDLAHRVHAHAVHIDIAWFKGDLASARLHSAMVTELSQKAGTPYLVAYATSYEGLVAMMGGDWPAAIELLERALRYMRSKKAGLENETRVLADIADSFLHSGQRDQALRMAIDAAALADRRAARAFVARARLIRARLDGNDEVVAAMCAEKAVPPALTLQFRR